MNPLFILDVRKGTLKEAAQTCAKQVKAAEQDAYRADGAAKALKIAFDRVNGLHQVLEANRDSALGALSTEAQVTAAKFAKNWVTQAATILEEMGGQKLYERHRNLGRAAGVQQALDILESMFEAESKRANAIRERIDSGEIVVEEDGSLDVREGAPVSGNRPAKSLAQQRREEEAAEKAAEESRAKKSATRKKRTKKS